MTLENIIKSIKKAESIVLLTHENPDGDALGSSLAMYCALINYGKDVDLIIPEYSAVYSFLPKSREIKKESNKSDYDLAIALDCADIKRLNGFAKYFEDAQVTVSIDHHGVNTMFADYNFVDPVSPSCAQILIQVIETLGLEITKEIGTCILTGIITDTGGFKYSSVTVETFEFVAKLLKKGINVSEIYKKVLETKSKSSFELTRIAYSRMELLENNKIACTYITKKDEEEVKTEIGDHEGIVDIGRQIEGVEVSLFLRETDDGIRISLRANNYVNVSDVALIFGGGGHIRAAGCTINGNIETVKQKVINEVKLYL